MKGTRRPLRGLPTTLPPVTQRRLAEVASEIRAVKEAIQILLQEVTA